MSANNDFYFAEDGSYGSADGITIVDTANWTDADWELIDFSTDSERAALAQKISDGYDD